MKYIYIMFRNKKLGCIMYNRVFARQISTASIVRTPSGTSVCCKPSDEKTLIPEHLRYNNPSFSQKFKKFMDSPSAPMLPMSIILVGIHVYVLWYLLGGEFESDFEDEEEVPFFSEFVRKCKSAGAYLGIPFRFLSRDQESKKHKVGSFEE